VWAMARLESLGHVGHGLQLTTGEALRKEKRRHRKVIRCGNSVVKTHGFWHSWWVFHIYVGLQEGDNPSLKK
jgi:hypothetical protein